MTYAVQHKSLGISDWLPRQADFAYNSLDEVARLDGTLRDWFSSDSMGDSDITSVRVLDGRTGEVVFLSSTRELNRAVRPF